MAVWQYSVYLIPSAHLTASGSIDGLIVDDKTFELPQLRFSIEPNDLESRVSLILPPTKSWDEKMRKFGDDLTNDVDIWFDGQGKLAKVRIRIDLKSNFQPLVEKFVNVAQAADCVFFDLRTLKVISADTTLVMKEIWNSSPAKYVKDPKGFLESIPPK